MGRGDLNTGEEITPVAAVPGTQLPSGVRIARGRIGYANLKYARDVDQLMINIQNLDNGQFGGNGTIAPYGYHNRSFSIYKGFSWCSRPGAGLDVTRNDSGRKWPYVWGQK
jgi:hypothetical protein